MTQSKIQELREQLYQMENSMRTLEWDYNRGQINPFKKQQFEVQLKEKQELISQINQIENQEES